MYLFGPLGCVDRAHSEPSDAPDAAIAAPGICTYFTPWIFASIVRTVAATITLGGRITVRAIGAGIMEPGDTDCGVAKFTPFPIGVCLTADDEHVVSRLAASATVGRTHERWLLIKWVPWRYSACDVRAEPIYFPLW